jgi:autotransporter-associated beta strand protein
LITNSDFLNIRMLTVSQTADTSYDGFLTGALGLTKLGIGKLTLTASNTYSGATLVNGGTLEVMGSLSGSELSVGAAGILAGTGMIATAVMVDGTLAPGASGPGTLTLGGRDLIFVARARRCWKSPERIKSRKSTELSGLVHLRWMVRSG